MTLPRLSPSFAPARDEPTHRSALLRCPAHANGRASSHRVPMAAVNAGWVAGLLLIGGSTLFLVGAAIAVPRVFMERDPTTRLRMLEERIRIWRAGPPFYALGPIVAGIGVVVLAADASDGDTVLFGIAGAGLVVGALAWSWSVYLRAARVLGLRPGESAVVALRHLRAAHNRRSGPPWHRLAGRRLRGLARLACPRRRCPVPGALPGDEGYPPFVFYLLLLVVGIAIF
jgi:hypothetical protein